MTDEVVLAKIFSEGGPIPREFDLLDTICNKRPDLLKKIDKTKIDFLTDCESIMGHVLQKPYGYAGDFEVIDRFYKNSISKNYARWDHYIQEMKATKAVKNRKEYFKNVIRKKIECGSKINVLNLASGPAREIKELFEEDDFRGRVTFTCIDLDKDAIAHAKKLNANNLDSVEFQNRNVIRFTTDKKYDIIWSAGLFDYFNDKVFTRVLSRMQEWLKEDGEIVVGNFNEDFNPNRNLMEIVCEWYLHHRTVDGLKALAIDAGYNEKSISVEKEDEGVNLFLRIGM